MSASGLPAGYLDGIKRVLAIFHAHRQHHPTARPHFRLGPREIMIAAPLQSLAARVCKDADAVDLLLDVLIAVPECTVFMFGACLEIDAGFDVERVALGELGLTVAQS
ncbi:MAG TPA: hypothetical protein VK989_13280 [Polyangia bacterium]|jgi:hypothetical protein|nr:hypothetical protein [Polyangia bacterium]